MKNHTKFNHKAKIKKMQLSFSFDLTNNFDMDDEVFLVHNIVEEMNLSFLNSAYSNRGRKPVAGPRTMLKILVFAYLNRKYSARDIEDACKYDLRFRWLLNNGKSPDHVTINRFRNKIYPFMDEVLEQLVNLLIEQKEIDLKSIYIDGTKIEANANRYTFVWKKSILKYQEKLIQKILKHFDIKEGMSSKDCKKLVLTEFNNLRNTCKSKNIIFVYGKGKRKSKEQRKYEMLKEWLDKLNTYEDHLNILGERNSYSKTDNDATFMRLKDDHMKNGQLKPAYNIQCATNGGYVVDIKGFSNPTDVRTLIPFMDDLLAKYGTRINRVVADSGYESEENYLYLKEKQIESFIKPSNYEIKRTRKYRNDISRKENMIYCDTDDYYICTNNKKLEFEKIIYRKNNYGFKSESRVYLCKDCLGCNYSNKCIKSKNTSGLKRIYVSKRFEELRRKSEENITTEEGITERLNRSIQAEGIFSYIKSGMRYLRFRHRSMNKIIAQMKLLSLAINIRKLSNKMKSKNMGFIRYKEAI
ncbi:IS1182 family transposase [Anaerosalibacter bizertensis]|uniref:IS1182 family transposase n=1 Tax=Anaerosalibacter bizertensis TaxID=932217 RepID=UPI001C0F1400|nr:IS1182 family transposase [Anaerosalibacter bizertensis]MBU5294286.1 IS1182 family transposase [Anaerosalibacter bizertensis]